MSGIWYYGYQKGFMTSASPEFLKAITRLYIFAPILSGVIFILSFFTIWICLTLFAIMFLIYVIPKNAATHIEKMGLTLSNTFQVHGRRRAQQGIREYNH